MARKHWRVEAEFEFVTPAFLAGAHNDGPNDIAELRPPSIIGALRFWWRALAWSRTSGTEQQRLGQVKRWENALFGSADTGRGMFSLQVEINKRNSRGRENTIHSEVKAITAVKMGEKARGIYNHGYDEGFGHIARNSTFDPKIDFDSSEKASLGYVTGIWIDNWRGQSISVGTSLTIKIISYTDPEKSFNSSFETSGRPPALLEALRLFGLIGGVGARVRRGYGSVRLSSLSLKHNGEKEFRPIWTAPSDRDSYVAAIEDILSIQKAPLEGDMLPPYTCWYRGCKIFLDSEQRKGGTRDMHARGLLVMRKWRSWFNYNPKSPIDPTGVTPHDHDWYYAQVGDVSVHSITGDDRLAPRKTAFGLPLTFQSARVTHKQGMKPGAQIQIVPKSNDRIETDRRASPLFLHIHKLSPQTVIPIWLYFPSRFLPDEMTLSVTRRKPGSKDGALPLPFGLPDERDQPENLYATTDAFVDYLTTVGFEEITGGAR